MTREEFFIEFDKLPKRLRSEVRKWLWHGMYEGAYCPITAVCMAKTKKRYTASNFEQAAKLLGIKKQVMSNIVTAADDVSGKRSKSHPLIAKYRKRLLDAVRLDK